VEYLAALIYPGVVSLLEQTPGVDAFAEDIAEDIAEVLEQRFFPRLDSMFASAKAGAAERVAVLTPDAFAQKTEVQLADLEARFAASIEQFSTVREEFARMELRVLEATARLDAIWADQDTTGIGGWRLVMRAVTASVKKNREQPAGRMDQFRVQEEVRVPSRPAILNLSCPKCHLREVRRLRRDTMLEEALRVLFIAPYRCHACGEKFHRMRYRSGG
jgi:hypothetical protein